MGASTICVVVQIGDKLGGVTLGLMRASPYRRFRKTTVDTSRASPPGKKNPRQGETARTKVPSIPGSAKKKSRAKTRKWRGEAGEKETLALGAGATVWATDVGQGGGGVVGRKNRSSHE